MPGEMLYRVSLPQNGTTLPIPTVSTERTNLGTAADLLPDAVPLRQTTTLTPTSPEALSGSVTIRPDAETTPQDRFTSVGAQIGGFGSAGPVTPQWEPVSLNSIPGGEGVIPDPDGIRVYRDAANPGSYQVTDPDWQEPRVFGDVHYMAIRGQNLQVGYRDRTESGSGNVRAFAQEEGAEVISLDGNERARWIEESRVGIEIQF
ncbi:MAG: hypothetical protein SFZ03_03360 [Candidatus Melainabacteria bacterium]|nr:hypothetical protein [Candidatus Melainabacteria bacterium]